MAKILLAGFMHETNTFAPEPTTFIDFEKPDSAPGLSFGQTILDVMDNVNLPSSGFIAKAQELGHSIVPTVWASAPPFGIVTKEAFDSISNMICDHIRDLDQYDAIYLDLHGAMVSELSEDGEGDLLKRIRDIAGPDLPIVMSLDLHANITEAMLKHSDYMDVFRTYPHVDASETGARCATVLHLLLTLEKRFHKQLIKLPFIMGLNSQCTLVEPAKSVYHEVELSNTSDNYLSVALGFALADIFDCGPGVVSYSFDEDKSLYQAQKIASFIQEYKAAFQTTLFNTHDAVEKARTLSQQQHPIIISDTQDNPGGGATSDTTGLLKALIEQKAKGAIVAIIHDPEAAMRAHEVGLNNELLLDLGGKSGIQDDSPLHGKFRVKALSCGQFKCEGPFYKNLEADLGPMAVLTIEGVDVIVSSRKMQAADQMIFKHMGLEPRDYNILGLKSSVHFMADFLPIAAHVITAEVPGVCTADIKKLSYKNIRSDLELL